ncbi:hypothetical protein D4R75_13585, partial [bacterium]
MKALYRFLTFFAPLLFIQGNSSAQTSDRWTKISSESLQSFVIDPVDTNIIHGGYWYGAARSIDGGATWRFAGFSGGGTTSALIINPQGRDTLYAGVEAFANGGYGVYRSTNRGNTWTNVYASHSVACLDFDRQRPHIIYAGTVTNNWRGAGVGLLKSTNAGTTWSQINTGLANLEIAFIAVDPFNGNTAYIGTGDGVFKSTNAGQQWVAMNSGLPSGVVVRSIAINPSDPKTVYVGTTNDGVFKSMNAAASWSASGSEIPYLTINSLLVNPLQPQVVYAGAEAGGVFRSSNSGSSWTAIDANGIDGSYYGSIGQLAVNPLDPHVLFAIAERYTTACAFYKRRDDLSLATIPSGPVLSSPSNGAASQPTTLTLGWTASTGATKYHLQVSTTSAFTTLVLNDSSLTGTSKSVAALANGITYYWRVRAGNSAGWSGYSGSWSFTTIVAVPPAPTLASPSVGATGVSTSGTLSWIASAGAASYRLQVSANSGFSPVVVDQSGITNTSFAMSGLANNTLYYWRVNATNTGGTSSYSSTWGFTTMAPVPTITSFSPVSGPIGTVVTITGTNFNVTASGNIVWFGAVQANVTAATTTSLIVTVPAGSTYAQISVTDSATGLTVYSRLPFVATFSAGGPITSASFASSVDFTIGWSPSAIAMSDLDRDGKPDVILTSSYFAVSVFRNQSVGGSINSGSLAPKVHFATGNFPGTVAIGDLDGDGKPDLAVPNNGSKTVSVFRNQSSRGSISSGSFAEKVDFATGTWPLDVAIGDLDGDGRPDLTVTNNGSASISVFRNISTLGSISFAPKVDFLLPGYPTPAYVAIADFDGDGKADLAVTNSQGKSVSVFRNTSMIGSISFASIVDFTTGNAPERIAIGDLDGDGKPDIAVVNLGSSSSTVSVFRNTSTSGSISFDAKVDYATGVYFYGLAMGDLNGDGKPDLAVTNPKSNTVSVFGNLSTSGSLSFAAKVDFGTGAYPCVLAIGDLDGDGKPDLAVGNDDSCTVSVFRNMNSSGSAPSASTNAVTNVTATSATLNGSVNPGGLATTAYFEWGRDTASLSATTSRSIGFGTGAVAVIDTLRGLSPRNMYYYRAVGQNSRGTNRGAILSFTTSTSATLLGEYSPDANTVLLLHMNETSGTTVGDASGYGNHGRANQGATVTSSGRFGNARSFDGSQAAQISFETVSDLTFGSQDFAAEVWVNTQSSQFLQPYIERWSGPTRMWRFGIARGAPWLELTNGGWHAELKGAAQINDGRWHHLAAVRENGISYLYADGVLQAMQDVSTFGVTDDSGGWFNVGDGSFNMTGIVDEVRVSKKARAPQEFNLQLPPKNLSAIASPTSINLSWQNGGAAVPLMRYKIYRGVDSTNVSLIDSTTSLLFSNTGLSPGTRYFYRVSAVDSTGFEGARSYAASATPSSPTTDLVQVNGGTFQMGSTTGKSDETPVHSVTLGAFSMDRTEITYEKWTEVRSWGLTHGYTDLWAGKKWDSGMTNLPVTQVSWYDILKWSNARSEKDGLTPVYYASNTLSTVYRTGELDLAADAVKWTANGYRLPTEAEWEFAARGGTKSQGYAYSGSDAIDDVAWCYANSGNNPHVVGTKRANELGLYDMSGNVFEWCWDLYGTYSAFAQADPKGPTSGNQHQPVLRGGAFNTDEYCRVAARSYGGAGGRDFCGFRCVQTDSVRTTGSIPATPQNLLATSGNGQVTLKWNKVPDTDLKRYRIYRGTASPANTLIDSTSAGNPNDTTRTITGLTNGTTYYFRVTAVDSAGNESAYSNEISATPSSPTIVLVQVTGGTFQMGSNDAKDYGASPPHSVTLGAFYINKTEITYEKWTDVRNWGLTHGYMDLVAGRNGYSGTTNHPVTEVNWYDILKWCNARSEKDGLTPVYYTSSTLTTVYRTGELDLASDAVKWTANGYRLPTEAEWEFAARGGTKSQGCKYSGSNAIDGVAWWYGNSGNNTHPVSTKGANELGLYDMSGNVWEWCWDLYGTYSASSQTDPKGPTSGAYGVLRGGALDLDDYGCSVAYRSSGFNYPNYRFYSIGFRCVQTDSSRTTVTIPSAPALASPADGATGVPISPTLSWGASAGATSYRLQVSTGSTFTTTVFDDSTLTATSRQVGPLSNNTKYYWRVNAKNAGGTSAFSPTQSFTTLVAALAAPALATPADGATGVALTTTLSWTAVTGATTYRIQLSTSSGFTTTIVNDSTLTGTSRQVGPLSNGTLYYWRVSAANAGGTSSYSSTRSFTTSSGAPSAPTQASPSNGSTGVSPNPTIVWNASSGATSYHLQVFRDAACTNVFADQDNLTGTSTQVFGGLTNTTYYWRINVTNTGGTSSWSSVWSFTTGSTAPPLAPSQVSPASGATGVSPNPTFTWNASSGATTYRLQVSQSATFASTIVNDSTLTATSKQVGPLSFSTTYYWRVGASNIGGSGSYSPTASFTTIPAPATTLTVNTSVSFPTKQKRQDYTTSEYRLFGLPGGAIAANSVLSGTPGADWQMYWDNGASSNYQVAYDGSSTFQFGNGRAFWILSRSGVNISTIVN